MRLKSIEMQGFKSFPDRTVIEFGSGVTCIIGPNGSGKSNISDAVRWVLGEMKMKSLRGNKMEDVIFNGAGDRAPANCASVSIAFDTEEEYLSSQTGLEDIINGGDGESDTESKPAVKKALRLGDFHEVVVTRKYYRSGESEYYINKQQTRLHDIYDMFYDTGIGREGYSVIGQGKISEILSQKADERRSVFEEAAGISRYRVRKEESERRLAEVQINLDRASDVLNEVTSQLEPLRKQADDAREYLTLGQEKRGIELTLWLDKTDLLRQKRVECAESLSAAKMALDNAEDNAAALERRLDELLEKAQNDSRLAGEAEQAKSAAERCRAELSQRSALCRGEIAHLNENAAALLLAAETARNDITSTEALIEGASAALEILEKELAEAEKASANAREGYENKASELNALTEKENGLNQIYTQALETLGRIMSTIAVMDSELESLTRAADESDSRIAASQERVNALGEETARAQQTFAGIQTAVSELIERRNALDAASEQILAELDEKKHTEMDERLKLTADEQRREHLRQLEKLLSGYSEGVKAVMNASSAGKIKKGSKPVAIRGLVSTLLSAKGEYVTALETALAASVQFIVVEDEEDARECIRYLKSTAGGKATFLPLTSVRGRRSDVSAIKNFDGFIGIASDKAECAGEYSGIADELLGRTVIAENLEKASVMARAVNYAVRFVTLDGQMINAGGSYTGGSVSGRTGLFTRARDLETLSQSIRERNKTLFDLNREIENTEKRLADNKALSDETDAEIEEKRQQLDEAGSVLSACKARLDEENGHLASLYETKNSGLAGASDTERRREEALKTKAEAENAILSAKNELEKLHALIASTRAESQRAYDASGEALEIFFGRRNAFSAQQRSAEALRERAAEARKRLDSALSGRETALAEASVKETEALSLESQAKEAESEANAAGELMTNYLTSRERTEAETGKLRASLKQAQAGRDEAFRAHSLHETACARIDEEIDLITAKMWDGYELTYSTAEQYRLPDDKMKGAQSRLNYLSKRIRSMGAININAVEQYAEVKQRYDFLSGQINDLTKSRRSLDSTIAKLSVAMKETFISTLEKINTAFDEVFRELFGGGGARVELDDLENPLECGIEISLKIPGKHVRSISLLSGGEQSFAAIALYLSLQKINPAPFCIFDEIESALDDVNLCKLADYVRRESEKTQYILITHRRGTMERADTLYGVTMPRKGISTYLKLDLAKMEEHIKRYV